MRVLIRGDGDGDIGFLDSVRGSGIGAIRQYIPI